MDVIRYSYNQVQIDTDDKSRIEHNGKLFSIDHLVPAK